MRDGGVCLRPHSSKIDAQLSLELTREVRLGRDDAKVGAVGAQIGRVGFGMIQYVCSIHTDLRVYRLPDPERFAHARIKTPTSRPICCALSQRAPCCRKGILEKDCAGLGIRDGVEGTKIAEAL